MLKMRRAVHVTLRDRNHETQVRLHQFLPRLFVAFLGALREFALFVLRKQRRFPDLLQIHLHRVRHVALKCHRVVNILRLSRL